MTDAFVLFLDTTPPVVEFGEASGTTAGEFFGINYTSNEPLEWAALIDSGGRRVALAVNADTLSVLLPPDIYDGWATIEWADDVGNVDRAVAVRLTGAVVQPQEPRPPSGMPRPDKRPMIRRRLTARSRIEVSSRSRRTEATRTRQRRTSYAILSTARVRTRQFGEVRIAISARSRRRAGAHWSGVPVTVNTTSIIRRRDDPTIEAFLLDLL